MKRNILAGVVLFCFVLMPLEALAQYTLGTAGTASTVSQDSVTGDVIFSIGGVEKMRVTEDGKLVTTSGVMVSEQSSCDAQNEGTIHYKNSTDSWQYCDGYVWQNFSAGGTCLIRNATIRFKDVLSAAPGMPIHSNPVAIEADGCEAEVSISGDGSPEYRICSPTYGCSIPVADWTSAPGAIEMGQMIQVRLTASTTPLEERAAVIKIGSVTLNWKVKTAPAFYRIFVSSTGSTGNTGGIGGGDHTCRTLATAAGLPGRYKAFTSSANAGLGLGMVSDAAARLHHSPVPYRLVDGTTTIADNWYDLLDGEIQAPINQTQTGATVAGVTVWTGTEDAGTYSTNDCASWTTALAGEDAVYGSVDDTYSGWLNAGTGACNVSRRFYCVQQPDEAPAGVAGVDYKRVFVTSTSYNGNLGGLAGADAKCNTRAAAAGLSGTYKAFLAGSSSLSAPVSYSSGFTLHYLPYRHVNGVKFSDDFRGFASGANILAYLSGGGTGYPTSPDITSSLDMINDLYFSMYDSFEALMDPDYDADFATIFMMDPNILLLLGVGGLTQPADPLMYDEFGAYVGGQRMYGNTLFGLNLYASYNFHCNNWTTSGATASLPSVAGVLPPFMPFVAGMSLCSATARIGCIEQ